MLGQGDGLPPGSRHGLNFGRDRWNGTRDCGQNRDPAPGIQGLFDHRIIGLEHRDRVFGDYRVDTGLEGRAGEQNRVRAAFDHVACMRGKRLVHAGDDALGFADPAKQAVIHQIADPGFGPVAGKGVHGRSHRVLVDAEQGDVGLGHWILLGLTWGLSPSTRHH